MAYETNRFCWHGAVTTDVEATKAFYAETIGWTVQGMAMDGQEMPLFAAGGVPLAHVAPPRDAGVPSHWASYLRVDDVDAASRAAAANGGKVLAPPMDIPPGRFGVVATPSGAALCLYHEADEAGSSHHPGGEGSVHWVELHSKDLAKDLAWLKAVFGFDSKPMGMPDGSEYHVLSHRGQDRGGAMTGQADAPAMWLVWFAVADVDAALARANRSGGRTIAPIMEVPGVGRMAIVMDPVGAVAGIITPAG